MPTLLPEAVRGPGTGYFGPVVSTVTGVVRFTVIFAPQAQPGTVSCVLMQAGRLLLNHTGTVGNTLDLHGNTVPGGVQVELVWHVAVQQEYEAVLVSTVPVDVTITADLV